jgi:superfamily II DNA/RNA helicase
VARQLDRAGVSSAPIHGARSQNQRDRALRSFATGRVSALVATDVAARGIHVDGVAAVVHFDPPEDAAAYLHRSGRTARAGATGVVVSLVHSEALRDTGKLQRDLGLTQQMDPIDLELVPDEISRGRPPETAVPHREEDKPRSAKQQHGRKRRPRGDRPAHDDPSTGNGERPSRSHPRPVITESAKTGKVRFFDSRKGYGFITREGQPDLFVHHSNISGDGFRSLEGGQDVSFDLKDGRKGPEACNVQAA